MPAITADNEGRIIVEETYGSYVDVEPMNKPTTEKPSTPAAHSVSAGDAEKRFKAEEDLKRATTPNLQNLDREHVLWKQIQMTQAAEEKFSLLQELFKLKIEALKHRGVSIEEFTKKYNEETGVLGLWIPRFDDPLKNEIVKLYTALESLATEQGEKGSRRNLALEIYQLEQETGFSDFGPFLLWKAVENDFNLIKSTLRCKDFAQMDELYWKHFIPNFQKILRYIEADSRDCAVHQRAISQACDILALYQKRFPPSSSDANPFTPFLPVLLDYISLEQAEFFFPEQFKDLTPLDKIGRYIDLFCQAAQMVASTDKDTAVEYLNMARDETMATLWTFPYPFNNKAYEQKRQECLAKIDQITSQLAAHG